ncbi:MAG: glycoside hydrolase family 9 protein [Calditrichota bacterium]
MKHLFSVVMSTKWWFLFPAIFLLAGLPARAASTGDDLFIRANQVGYLPADTKVAIAFSVSARPNLQFELLDARTGHRAWGPHSAGPNTGPFGRYAYHYRLDFTEFEEPGRYTIRLTGTGIKSLPFTLGPDAYDDLHERMLTYFHQQRCGYNPFLDEACHRLDGRTAYGPVPDSTYLDVSGGWHDAGDDLRYLLTSGNTVGRMLFTYRENRGKFHDRYNALGQPYPNDIPDILDEAKWGLDWMLKMHPQPDQLYHQVGDDRDHVGFKLPYQDTADYGWGPNSYRVVYYATGKPQGLRKYQNTSTGIANLAGRYAAVMAMAAAIWQQDLGDSVAAARFFQAGKEVYNLGLRQPGCQEGTPCTSPYRYHEITWADDMEWGAAEMYKQTENAQYLRDAQRFAKLANTVSWMGADTARHYEYYPFMNLGHYELYPLVDSAFQDTLAGYYRSQLEAIRQRALRNPYRIGYPFIWCSNNLAAALITQAILYEKMTGDDRYRPMALEVRDWLLGRNPWGVSQFVGIPAAGITPLDPHGSIPYITGREITGGLNDGPIYTSTYRQHHIELTEPDEYTLFQSSLVVYHDDLGDYSTNEPTLDGTAETLFWMVYFDRILDNQ